jgi:hypothetical protein
MVGSVIRELSPSNDGMRIAGGFAEDTIQVWDLATCRMIVELSTVFRFGSQNLAIGGSGDLLVATDTDRSGRIAAYKISTGEEAWRREYLSSPARVSFRESGEQFWYSELGTRTAECVEASTGITLETIKNARAYIEGHDGTALLVPWERSSPYVLIDRRRRIKIERLTFALLATAFASDCVFVSESGGPIRCLNYSNGGARWMFTPDPGSHALRLHYSPTNDLLYAIIWQFDRGLFRHLVSFDPRTGEHEFMRELSSWEECFIPVREHLLTSDGLIIDLATNKGVGLLGFSKMVYPDPDEVC